MRSRIWLLLFVGIALASALALHAVHAQPAITIPANKAAMLLTVPGDAIVTVNGQPTKQTGVSRLFYTPELAPGTYSYNIEARWNENGKDLKVTRQIEVTTGRITTLTITSADAGQVAQARPPEVKKTPPETAKVTPPEAKKPEVKKPTPPPTAKVEPLEGKTRAFEFTYQGKVKDLPADKVAKIWLPVATSNSLQEVILQKKEPANAQLHSEPQYGNTFLYFEGKADAKGEVPFKVTYVVRRKEVKTDPAAMKVLAATETGQLVKRYLSPDAKVPVDGKPIALIKDRTLPGDPLAAAKSLYDVVYDYMEYKKVGTGWGQGDSNWACDSKYGNCTDFHSLFISLARSKKIPCKFEMGFGIPPKTGEGPVGGYHCWAWFMVDGKGWVPVDISEAKVLDRKDYYFGNLTEHRVQFTTGRDFDLVPKQAGGPINFLIYPYVEVDGQSLAADKIERAFAYKDVQ
jgi:uncharacterized protein (TIGR03000 family)